VPKNQPYADFSFEGLTACLIIASSLQKLRSSATPAIVVYAGGMAIRVVSFIDSRFPRVARRLKRQAKKFEIIDDCVVLSEGDLDSEFVGHFGEYLSGDRRGFGYYCWKPQVILQALREMSDGDTLIYLDAGSHLNSQGKYRLDEYIRVCRKSSLGILAFQTNWIEREWTKGDVFDHFGVRNDVQVTETGQVQAGLILVNNSQSSRALISKWLNVYRHSFFLGDDSPSISGNLPGFRQTRHDQSLFSLLSKINGAELLPASDQDRKVGELGWRGSRGMPVQHRRDLPGHASRTLRVRLGVARRKLDLVLVRLKARILGTGSD
jgi:hypothetical protein